MRYSWPSHQSLSDAYVYVSTYSSSSTSTCYKGDLWGTSTLSAFEEGATTPLMLWTKKDGSISNVNYHFGTIAFVEANTNTLAITSAGYAAAADSDRDTT